MALYEVVRNDAVKLGEFDSALVIAGGTAQARKAVAHLKGVKPNGRNLIATAKPTTGGPELLSVYWDETELVEGEPIPYHV